MALRRRLTPQPVGFLARREAARERGVRGLVAVERGVPEAREKDDTRRVGVVAHLVLEAVVEDERLALAPPAAASRERGVSDADPAAAVAAVAGGVVVVARHDEAEVERQPDVRRRAVRRDARAATACCRGCQR